ncbi:MAG: hypothetical protein JRI23_30875 [Deltaproteobacteria bacterium]|jgi:hypothetical protein|nr:hypothetical protein [Deltaproteobacteria bacterium]MBW2536602.1 hypothetical protein [Deltaproteobacteria bacterium]
MTASTSNPFRIAVVAALPSDAAFSYSSTFHSIGFRWDLDPVADDLDYNAVVTVEYRKMGDAAWKNGANLLRTDYTWWWNTADPYPGDPVNRQYGFAGSLMFLTPGTNYEVRLTYVDPDGNEPLHGTVRQGLVATRAIPIKPTGGRTYYVDPTRPNGDGSDAAPWNSIDAAQGTVVAGDRVRLRTGTYSGGTLSASGAENNWILYEPDIGHSPVIHAIGVTGSHIWIDGLSFVWNGNGTAWYETSGIYVPPLSPVTDDVVITACDFRNYKGAITCPYPLSRWVIIDNSVVGVWATDCWLSGGAGTTDDWGIRVGGEDNPGGPECVVAYNNVTRTIDGIDFGHWNGSSNCDVYGNQIWDTRGNQLSSDGSGENNRIWGNRLTHSASFPLTFQPQHASPWYFLYNQVVEHNGPHFKWRVQDRMVFINNTFAGAGLSNTQGQHIMRSFCRNNLWIKESSQLWNSVDDFDITPNIVRDPLYTADWRTDIDYDGVDVAGGVIVRWFDNTTNYSTFADVFSNIGIWQHGVALDADAIFASKVYEPNTNLTLAPGANAAVAAGQKVNNLADWYANASTVAPDLGCHNRTDGPPHYGQRTSELHLPLHERTDPWSKH